MALLTSFLRLEFQALKKDQDELHKQTNPELDKAISELMDQTRDLMKSQEEISRLTEDEKKAMEKAQQEALDKMKNQVAELQKKINEMKEMLMMREP